MTKRSPTEFAFSKILRTSGIEPGSPESILLADLDDLKLDDVSVDDFIAGVAEVLHDERENEYTEQGWIVRYIALAIASELLVRAREDRPVRGSKLPVESSEEFGKLPFESGCRLFSGKDEN